MLKQLYPFGDRHPQFSMGRFRLNGRCSRRAGPLRRWGRRIGPRAAVLAGVLVLAACEGGFTLTTPDIERTWSQAIVVLPAETATAEPLVARMSSASAERRLRVIAARTRLPVAIYLHGCTGVGNLSFLKELAATGVVVIAPDSFARRYRPLQCDPKTKTGGRNLFVYDFRLAELTFALERLGEAPWADLNNLFLVGNSEGGVAAALFRGDVFNARVITQWTCQGAPLVRGIGAPESTPILAIVRENDPFYDVRNTPEQQGHCGAYLAGRPASRSVVLTAGEVHDVYNEPAAVQTILDFIGRHRR